MTSDVLHPHTRMLRRQLSTLLRTRSSSPHLQAETLSSLKPVEEETLPKYNPKAFYPAKLFEVLNDRYKLIAKLGYGMTATVWLAKDLKATPSSDRKYVTIKINVNTLSDSFKKGRREIAERLQVANPGHAGYKHVRFMLDSFKIKGRHGDPDHLCIVYDVLREPINQCMDKWPGRLFDAAKLRILVPALLKGLDYLHSECQVVHTDLKGDNIMMGLGDPTVLEKFVQQQMDRPAPRKSPDSHGRVIYQSCSDFGAAPTDSVIASAKITDIGLAAWGNVPQNGAIQSNAFTAPEVILTAGWSYPADIWNLGVMLWDLFEPFGLFDAIDTRPSFYKSDKHLGLMIGLMGPPPKTLLERGSTSATYFDDKGNFRNANLISDSISFENSVTRMKGEEKELFIDFVRKMVTWLPEDRWTAKQLLEHPWLTKPRETREEWEELQRLNSRVVDGGGGSDAGNKSQSQSQRTSAAAPSSGRSTPIRIPPTTTSGTKGLDNKGSGVVVASSVASTNTIESSSSSTTTAAVSDSGTSTTLPSIRRSNTSNVQSQDLINSILGTKS